MIAFFKFNNLFLEWLTQGLWAIPLIVLGFIRAICGMRNFKSLQVESALQFTVWFVIMAQLLGHFHFYDKVFWLKGVVFLFLVIYYLLFYGGLIVYSRIRRQYHGFYKALITI